MMESYSRHALPTAGLAHSRPRRIRKEKSMPCAQRSFRRLTWAVKVILINAVLAFPVSSLYAADGFKMGVVDPQAVLEKSRAGKRALDTLKEYAATRQKLLAGDEEELKNLEKQLKEQESGLSETAKRDKQSQFRTKLQDYQKRAQEFNQELAGKQKELVDEYMKKISTATRTVAEKGGFTLVVDKGSENTIKIVIYHRDALDLTDQVIKEFDRQNK
jgi:outer membrane protein